MGYKSLSYFIGKKIKVRSKNNIPDLSLTQIKIWMLEWFIDNQVWPTAGDGEIPNSGGDKWKNLNSTMFNAGRGLKKTSVAEIKNGLIDELDDLPTSSQSNKLEDKIRSLLSVYETKI